MIAVDVIDTEPGLDALAAEWDALADAAGLSAFQTFAWQRAWWRHIGCSRPEARLRVVVARSGREIVAIAPFFTERVGGRLGVRRLAFLGRGTSDYLDLLARPEHSAEAIAKITACVAREIHFDVGFLEDVSDRSPNLRHLVGALRASALEPAVLPGEPCPRTRLLDTWEKTLASFSIERRREVRRRRRNLEKAAKIALEVGGAPSTVASDIEQLISMHQERWTASGHSGALADASVQRFHREVARELAARGRTFFGFLVADGRRIAVLYGFRWRDELQIYQTGQHDPGALRRYSPGRVLTSMCMEHAIEEGASVYDFLRGDEPYKRELEGKDVMNRTLMFVSRGSLVEQRYKAALLGESLERRARSELLLWRHATRDRGALSTSSLAHFAVRARAVARDGVEKLRSPATPVTRATDGDHR